MRLQRFDCADVALSSCAPEQLFTSLFRLLDAAASDIHKPEPILRLRFAGPACAPWYQHDLTLPVQTNRRGVDGRVLGRHSRRPGVEFCRLLLVAGDSRSRLVTPRKLDLGSGLTEIGKTSKLNDRAERLRSGSTLVLAAGWRARAACQQHKRT